MPSFKKSSAKVKNSWGLVTYPLLVIDPDAYDEYQYAHKFDLSQYSEKKNRYNELQCDESYVTVNGNKHDNYSDKFNSDARVRTVCVIHSDMKADEFNPSRYGMEDLFTRFRGDEHDWKCDTIYL